MSTGSGGIWVDRIAAADGARYVVYLGGTDNFAIGAARQTVWNLVPTYQGRPKRSQLELLTNTLAQDRNPNATIMLVGFSQGGMDAQNIAEKTDLSITTVVTYGAPIIYRVPAKYEAIHIAALGDPLPGFSHPDHLANHAEAGKLFLAKPNTYDGYYFWRVVNPFWPMGIHGDRNTYRNVGAQFDRSPGYAQVKSSIATFTGAVVKTSR